MVLSPIVRGRKGEYRKELEELRARGLHAREGRWRGAAARGADRPRRALQHDISVVVDRLVMRPDLRKRLADSVETAVALADGMVEIETVPRGDEKPEHHTYSERFACLHCGISMRSSSRALLVQLAARRVPALHRARLQMEIDPDLVVPGPSLSLAEGAILPWSTGSSAYYDQITQAIADRYEVDLDTPWDELDDDVRDAFLYGTNGDRIYVSYRNRMGASAPT